MKGKDTPDLARLGKISEQVLEVIAVGGVVTTAALIKGCAALLAQGKYAWRTTHEMNTYIDTTVDRLIQQEIIVKNTNGNTVRLTKKGHWESARRRYLDNPKYHVPKHWDKKWRVVVFDIPELERRQRDMLRKSFVRFGFYFLQQSVWAYPYQCDSFINALKNDLGFETEVLYMLVDSIENQDKLEEEFGLN